jgi:dihydropteroate synthase
MAIKMSEDVENAWFVTGGRGIGPAPFLLAGIVNVTPDSFYDGGMHCSCSSAVDWGLRLHAEGAHVLDIGGESTRPGAAYVSCEEEISRVLPVVQGLLGRNPALLISVDTYKAEVARRALDAGAVIVNDISGFSFDPELKDVVVQYKPGYVLMHTPTRPEAMQNNPCYDDVVGEILEYFEKKMALLVKAGLPENRIVLDPGIGFGKSLAHNLTILQHIDRFNSLGRPVYMGLSNKSLWEKLLGLSPEDRGGATQVATALLAARGVCIHRVHDVATTVQTLRIVQAMA